MSRYRIVRWDTVGSFALLFDGAFVTAGSQEYLRMVRDGAPVEACEAATSCVPWNPVGDGGKTGR